MFKWTNKSIAEILEQYGGNVFMAELDYQAQGFSNSDWIALLTEAKRTNLITLTELMVMTERAAVR